MGGVTRVAAQFRYLEGKLFCQINLYIRYSGLVWKLRHWRWVSFLIALALAGTVTISSPFLRDCSALQAVTLASSAAKLLLSTP